MGELWAVPIMIRLVLIENLRRVAVRIEVGQRHRELAARWATQLLSTAEMEPANLILVLADMARSKPSLTTSFVAELSRRLQEKIQPGAFAHMDRTTPLRTIAKHRRICP